MEKDVVCGMQVDPAKAAGTSEYKGKTYYFCAKICKTKFDANPTSVRQIVTTTLNVRSRPKASSIRSAG